MAAPPATTLAGAQRADDRVVSARPFDSAVASAQPRGRCRQHPGAAVRRGALASLRAVPWCGQFGSTYLEPRGSHYYDGAYLRPLRAPPVLSHAGRDPRRRT